MKALSRLAFWRKPPMPEPDHGWIEVEVEVPATHKFVATHTICANPAHPNGAWHLRIQPSWPKGRRDNIKAHGCACHDFCARMMSGDGTTVPTEVEGATVVDRYDPLDQP